MAAIQPQVATQGFNLIITDRAAEEVKKFMVAEQVPVESRRRKRSSESTLASFRRC